MYRRSINRQGGERREEKNNNNSLREDLASLASPQRVELVLIVRTGGSALKIRTGTDPLKFSPEIQRDRLDGKPTALTHASKDLIDNYDFIVTNLPFLLPRILSPLQRYPQALKQNMPDILLKAYAELCSIKSIYYYIRISPSKAV